MILDTEQDTDIKDNNILTNGKNAFDQAVNNDLRTYDSIRIIMAGQVDD